MTKGNEPSTNYCGGGLADDVCRHVSRLEGDAASGERGREQEVQGDDEGGAGAEDQVGTERQHGGGYILVNETPPEQVGMAELGGWDRSDEGAPDAGPNVEEAKDAHNNMF